MSPSKKFHEYVSVSPSGSVPFAVNAIGIPTRWFPVGVRLAVTVGFWLAPSAVTVTGSVAEPVPPRPSDTVTTALNVPTAV